MRYVSIDIETTGLDPERCDIVEFAAVIDDLAGQKPLDELPRFHRYVLPPEGGIYRGQPAALAMHARIFRQIAHRTPGPTDGCCSPQRLGGQFQEWLARSGFARAEGGRIAVVAAGKNFAGFDRAFLDRLPRWGNSIAFHRRVLDPAMLYLRPDDAVPPSLADCMLRAAIEGPVTHEATDDALMVVRLLRKGTEGRWPN